MGFNNITIVYSHVLGYCSAIVNIFVFMTSSKLSKNTLYPYRRYICENDGVNTDVSKCVVIRDYACETPGPITCIPWR